MNTVDITTTLTATYDAKQSNTKYILDSGAEIKVYNGYAIDASSGAADRTIIINGHTLGLAGIVVGDEASRTGGGKLILGTGGIIEASSTGIYSGGANQSIVNHGYILGDDGIFSDGTHLSVDNSGILYGTVVGAHLAGGNSSIVSSGTLIAPTAIRIDGGSDSVNHVFNSGILSGSDHAIVGSGGSDFIRNSGEITGDIDLGFGDDVFDGRGGTITGVVAGGGGDDRYIVSSTATVLEETDQNGNDTVKASVSYTLGANLENLVLDGTHSLTGTGNQLDNFMKGNQAVNVLFGGDGKDRLNGAGGNDFLNGGNGSDLFIFTNHSGKDEVLDFQAGGVGHDRVDLSDLTAAKSFADVSDHWHQHGNDAVVAFGHGDVLTLHNVDIDDLSKSDFLF